MTNQEKAIEVACRVAEGYGVDFEPLAEAALDMAEWKDQQAKESFKKFYDKGLGVGKSVAKQQFKEYLEKKRGNVYWDETSLIDRKTKLDLLDEIINELFKED